MRSRPAVRIPGEDYGQEEEKEDRRAEDPHYEPRGRPGPVSIFPDEPLLG